MKNQSKHPQFLMYFGAILYGIAIAYIIHNDSISTGGLALGTVLVIYAITDDLAISLICGSLVGFAAVKRKRKEGFSNEEDNDSENDEPKENFVNEDEPVKKVKKSKKKSNPPPNNGERAEFLELGKKYKAPSEDDDKDFHLDAGTTFLNAYKSLKPDQVASMTKDTQDLMQTQKQLMSTLHTLKPLIKDGKEMMNMFQSYFGAGDPTTV